MKKFQITQERPDPDSLSCELSGIAAGIMICYDLLDGGGSSIMDTNIILDYLYSLSEFARRISDDLGELGMVKRSIESEMESMKKSLQAAQAHIDAISKAKAPEEGAEGVTA